MVFAFYLVFFWFLNMDLVLNKGNFFGLHTNNKTKGFRNKTFAQNRYYSTTPFLNPSQGSGSIPKSSLTDEEFAHWFSGFCDAEGCFYISNTGNNFTFVFKIKLHIDDIEVLQYIQQRLGIGRITVYKNEVIFTISRSEDLPTIFKILEIKPLNTTKYLNYLAFKEGYLLYFNNKTNQSLILGSTSGALGEATDRVGAKVDKSLLFNKLIELKNSMNSQRTNFELPDTHKIIITPYWLLGFIEGDGSFSISNIKGFPTLRVEI